MTANTCAEGHQDCAGTPHAPKDHAPPPSQSTTHPPLTHVCPATLHAPPLIKGCQRLGVRATPWLVSLPRTGPQARVVLGGHVPPRARCKVSIPELHTHQRLHSKRAHTTHNTQHTASPATSASRLSAHKFKTVVGGQAQGPRPHLMPAATPNAQTTPNTVLQQHSAAVDTWAHSGLAPCRALQRRWNWRRQACHRQRPLHHQWLCARTQEDHHQCGCW